MLKYESVILDASSSMKGKLGTKDISILDEAKALSVIDGKTLLSLDIEPPKFIIDRFLPAGLHMLAGSPKIGKSWLALWLCQQISKLTLQIVVWTMDGYSQREVAKWLSLTDKAVYCRMDRLKEKIKKYLSQ